MVHRPSVRLILYSKTFWDSCHGQVWYPFRVILSKCSKILANDKCCCHCWSSSQVVCSTFHQKELTDIFLWVFEGHVTFWSPSISSCITFLSLNAFEELHTCCPNFFSPPVFSLWKENILKMSDTRVFSNYKSWVLSVFFIKTSIFKTHTHAHKKNLPHSGHNEYFYLYTQKAFKNLWEESFFMTTWEEEDPFKKVILITLAYEWTTDRSILEEEGRWSTGFEY